MPRVLLYLIAIPILLVIAAVLLLPLFLDEDKLLALATETLEKQTGATLTVGGDANLSLFPRIAVRLDEVELALPGQNQPDLSARSLDIGVQLLPLLSGNIEIQGLEVDSLLATIPPAADQPGVDTSQMSDEDLDAFYAARRKALQEAASGNSASATLALPAALEVERLAILRSRVVLLADTGNPTIIDIGSLKAKDLNLKARPSTLSLTVALPREGSEPLGLDLDGVMRIDGDKQQLQISSLKATVTGATAEPLTLAASGAADLQRMAADLDLQLGLGPAAGQGSLRFASFESPQIDTSLHFNQFSPALFALAGPDAGDANDEQDDDSDDQSLPLDALRGIDTRAELEVDSAQFGAHTVTNLQARLRAVDGVLRIEQLSGKVHGGELSLSAVLDASHNRAKLNTRGSLDNMDLPQLLEALEAAPSLTGTASMNWELTSSGSTTNALRDQLDGPIAIRTADLVLKGMGVERMLCQAVALVNREQLSADLPQDSAFETLTADIQLAGGKARLAPLRAQLPHLALNGRGDIDLATLGFDATFKARPAASFAELDPACRINERYTSIDWPVACEGQLNGEPGEWCSVETGDIVEDLAKQEAKRKVQKEAGKLFDKLLNKDGD